MANNVTNTRISLRSDTAENWTANKDVILLKGEVAIVIDGRNQKLKIGDGESTFEYLPYVNQYEVQTDLLTAKDITARSIAQGYKTTAVPTGLAAGVYTETSANFGTTLGVQARALSNDNYSFVYNGNVQDELSARYTSHGEGTFNVNPKNGLSGFYIGETSLADSHYTRAQTDEIYMSRFNAEAVIHDYIMYRVVPELSCMAYLDPNDASTYEIASKLNEFLFIAKTKWSTTMGSILSVDPDTASTYDISEKFNEILMVLKDETR